MSDLAAETSLLDLNIAATGTSRGDTGEVQGQTGSLPTRMNDDAGEHPSASARDDGAAAAANGDGGAGAANGHVEVKEQDAEGEDEDADGGLEDRRTRRMLSNRESARRSRQRKQAHLDELSGQTRQLWNENLSIQQNMGIVLQLAHNIRDENMQLEVEAAQLGRQILSMHEHSQLHPQQAHHPPPQQPDKMHAGQTGQLRDQAHAPPQEGSSAVAPGPTNLEGNSAVSQSASMLAPVTSMSMISAAAHKTPHGDTPGGVRSAPGGVPAHPAAHPAA